MGVSGVKIQKNIFILLSTWHEDLNSGRVLSPHVCGPHPHAHFRRTFLFLFPAIHLLDPNKHCDTHRADFAFHSSGSGFAPPSELVTMYGKCTYKSEFSSLYLVLN